VCAQYTPLAVDRLISPHERSGVGTIRLQGQDKVLDVSLVESRVQNDSKSFTADVVLDHGQAVRAHLRFCSQADGTWTIHEKLVARADVTLAEVATGLIGILNDRRWIYQRGNRQVRIADQPHTVASCSGQVLRAPDAKHLDVDDALHITSERPLCVRYQAASKPIRGRATDELCLNVIEGERHWQTGQTISEFEVAMRVAAK